MSLSCRHNVAFACPQCPLCEKYGTVAHGSGEAGYTASGFRARTTITQTRAVRLLPSTTSMSSRRVLAVRMSRQFKAASCLDLAYATEICRSAVRAPAFANESLIFIFTLVSDHLCPAQCARARFPATHDCHRLRHRAPRSEPEWPDHYKFRTVTSPSSSAPDQAALGLCNS